jgi:hypothetical protein
MFELKAQPEPYSKWLLIEIESRSAMLDLTMTLLECEDDVCGYLNYHADLHEPETKRRMSEAIAANLDTWISELPLPNPRNGTIAGRVE